MQMATETIGGLGTTRCGDCVLVWGERTYIMGIINMTPDSFSGDGLGVDLEAALARARRFEAEGADIIDIGGESTRPGHKPISPEEELRRVIPVIERLAGEVRVPISVDTYKAPVAERAVNAGARMINDVWGLKQNAKVAEVAAKAGLPLVLMHNQQGTAYQDLLPDIIASLQHSIDVALRAGVSRENIIVDPGIGFGKTAEHNLEA